MDWHFRPIDEWEIPGTGWLAVMVNAIMMLFGVVGITLVFATQVLSPFAPVDGSVMAFGAFMLLTSLVLCYRIWYSFISWLCDLLLGPFNQPPLAW